MNGDEIRKLRLAQRLTQEQLAAQAGIGQSMLSMIEKGRVNPSIDTLQRIADALGARLTITLTIEAAATTTA